MAPLNAAEREGSLEGSLDAYCKYLNGGVGPYGVSNAYGEVMPSSGVQQ